MIREFFQRCKENEPAFCRIRCPFHLDVCEMMNKIQRGNYTAAYRLYQSAVAFPEIVAALCNEPCKEVCPRRDKDAPVELKKIEGAIVSKTRKVEPQTYNLPKKEKRVAVVGAGISGLSCALKLCLKKYTVVVFEKSNVLGGSLWKILPPDIFMNDINRQFKFDMPEFIYNKEIRGIDDEHLREFDAVYIAAGADSKYFAEKDILRECRLLAGHRGIFAGGSIKGADPVEAAAHGIQASIEIEKFLLTGIMPQSQQYPKTGLCQPDLDEITEMFPCADLVYSLEQAAKEAGRCLKCSCDSCRKKCDLVGFYNKSPMKIMEEVRGTTEVKSVVSDITVATKMISSCNQCGYCSEVCPENISFREMFLKARQQMLKKDKLPWAFNDFFLRDMYDAHEAKTFFSPVANKKAVEYLFFPGCQLGASDPRYVLESYKVMVEHEENTALLADCCGIPAVWAGVEISDNSQYKSVMDEWERLGKPVMVFACASCMKTICGYNKDVQGIMIYELFDRWEIKPKRKLMNAEYVVFDSCSARNDFQTQESVRNIARRAGAQLRQIDTQQKGAKCCGYGGQSAIVNPEYTESVIQKRIKESELPYITYCSNCRDTFAYRGKEAVHILDLLFDINDLDRKPPTFSERRKNRRILKGEISMQYDHVTPKQAVENREHEKPIILSNEMKEKINGEYILEEEVEKVIRYCEKTGKKMVSAEGNFIGHLKIGYMTYWVEYDDSDEALYLINAYSHRMHIQGSDEINA